MSTNPAAVAQAMPLLEKYGFTELARQQRLLYMGLGAADTATARLLNQRIIQPNASQIIEDFYDYLLNLPAMRRFLPELLIPRLKRTQEEYLLSFGIDFDTPYYFEYRLRIGIAHERVGLTLDLYQAAYRQMTALIIGAVPGDLRRQPEQYQDTINLILKIAALDMSLATDTYMAASVASLAESIANLKEQQEELTVEIQRDALTGAHSRRHVLERLTQMIQRQSRPGDIKFCIAMIDLDRFKTINDQYGHLAGDRLLHHVASTMKQPIRSVDMLGRYGGEEFLVILPDIDLNLALQIAERIRSNIAAKPFTIDKHSLHVTVSIGLSSFHPGDTVEKLLQRADKALYAAKAAGRNCVKTVS